MIRVLISESIVKEISNGDPDVENKLRVLMLEVEVMKQDGRQAPDVSFVKKKHWECLLQLQSRNQRSKYLMYLFKTSKTEENKKVTILYSRFFLQKMNQIYLF